MVARDKPLADRAAGAVLQYLQETQQGIGGPDPESCHLQHGRLHGVGLKYTEAPGIDRIDQRDSQGFSVRYFGSHRNPNGRAASAPISDTAPYWI